MPDVFFMTNRLLTGPASLPGSYGAVLSPPGSLRTGIARLGTADTQNLREGEVQGIRAAAEDGFSAVAEVELRQAKHLLVFVHGFANSFPDALARAGFNRDWFAAGGADTVVVAFTWPSPGLTISFENAVRAAFFLPFSTLISPLLGRLVTPAAEDYLADQARAAASGQALVSGLDRLAPVLAAVRKKGGRATLMAHSMGNHILAAAMAEPAAPQSQLFDEAFLLAADSASGAKGKALTWVKAVQAIAGRTSIYASQADDVLAVSQGVNGHERLGQRGEAGLVPGKGKPLRLVDCTATKGLDTTPDGNSGHYFYRRIPAVRDDIAATMLGAPGVGAKAL